MLIIRTTLLAGLYIASSLAMAQDYVIENIYVIPMTEEVVLEKHSVLVSDGKVAKICKRSRACRQKGAERINGKGKFLIPGLTDMHAHTEPGMISGSPEAMAAMLKLSLIHI